MNKDQDQVTSSNKKSTKKYILQCARFFFAGGAECFGAISITPHMNRAFRFSSMGEVISARDAMNRIYAGMYWRDYEVETEAEGVKA